MTNYASDTNKAVKQFDKNPKDIQKGGAALADVAQSFIKDTKDNAGEMACEATKFIKDEGQKNVRKAGEFVKEHPAKGVLYAIGIGAALAFIFRSRK